MSWQPCHLKQCKTLTLPHHATEHQRSVNNIWSCKFCNQGFVQIQELISELLTASIAKNATNKRKNMYSKILSVAECKTCKKRLWAVKYLILMTYTYPTAKQGHCINLQMDPLGDPLTTRPIQTDWEICIELDPN